MDGLLQLKRESDVVSYLGSLPKGLQEAYQKILENIAAQPGSAPVIAARAFRWIMDSGRALSPEELVAAVCQPPNRLVTSEPDVSIEFVLESCHNLVMLTGPSCRFSHLSVQEYLERHEWPNKPDDHLLGAVCLHLLMASEDISAQQALHDYAIDCWHHHFTDCDPEASEAESLSSPLLKRFLGHPTDSSDHYRRWIDKIQSYDLYRCLQAPHLAAFGVVALGLLATVTRWIDNQTLDPNLSSPEESLLHLAVESGNLAMCSRLLQSGADVNHATSTGETPVLRAVLRRDHSIIQLLQKQANIDVDKGRDMTGAPALCTAILLTDAKIVGLLLHAGANPNLMAAGPSSQGTSCSGFKPALHIAAGHGSVDILHILLRYKADPNLEAGIYMTPLANAVYHGGRAAIQCLLEHGADENTFRPFYDTDLGSGRNPAMLLSRGLLDYVEEYIPSQCWNIGDIAFARQL